jgi:CHAD domain-containing protein
MLTLADYAHQAIEQHSRKVSKQATKLEDLDHPDHPEAIHQMRVGLRRLRTALEGFGFALVLPKELSIQRVKQIAKSLGDVRDLDVLVGHLLTDLLPHLPGGEVKVFRQILLPKFKSQRQRAWRQVQRLLHSGKYAQFEQGLQTWLEQPQYQPIAQSPIVTVVPDVLMPLMCHLLLHPGWRIETLQDDAAWENLHDLRKQIKRMRYQMELCQNLYASAYAEQVKTWAQLQDLLGLLQDQVVLVKWLEKELKHPLDQSLPVLADQLWIQNQSLWHAWQLLRPVYLDPAGRNHLRSLCLNPTEPVTS